MAITYSTTDGTGATKMKIGLVSNILAGTVTMDVYTMQTQQTANVYKGYQSVFLSTTKYYLGGTYKNANLAYK